MSKDPKLKHLAQVRSLLDVEPLRETAGLVEPQRDAVKRQNGLWLKNARDTGQQKPLSPNNVRDDIYKKVAKTIGENPARFSCHSTRVDAAQEMAENEVDMLLVKHAGRWTSDRMPSRYTESIKIRGHVSGIILGNDIYLEITILHICTPDLSTPYCIRAVQPWHIHYEVFLSASDISSSGGSS